MGRYPKRSDDKKVRLHVTVSSDLMQRLFIYMSDRGITNKSDVVRRALRLLFSSEK